MIQRIRTDSKEEWLALRRKHIGGTDAAAIVGLNAFSSPFAVWAEKTGQVPEFEGNLRTEVGTYLEDFVAGKFEEATGKAVRRCRLSLVNDEYPFAIANVDRLIVGEDAGLEIKTASALNMKAFRGGEYPDSYYVQCVHYLAVTGRAKWYLAVLIGNSEFKIFEIGRDEAEIAALMEAEKNFRDRYVIPRIPPPVDGSAATTAAIKQIFGEPDGERVDLSGLEDVFAQRKLLSGQIKQLKEQLDGLDNQIKLQLGNAAGGSCGNWSVSWRLQGTAGLDRERFRAEHPEIDLGSYATQARVFRVTEKKTKQD